MTSVPLRSTSFIATVNVYHVLPCMSQGGWVYALITSEKFTLLLWFITMTQQPLAMSAAAAARCSLDVQSFQSM